LLRILKKIYLSPLGYAISLAMHVAALAHKPFMVYGFYNFVKGKFYRRTRISSTTSILARRQLDLGDNVWVWHNSILDASNGLRIGQGCQIGAWVGIFTHSSHIAIRLMGERYLHCEQDERIGYQKGAIDIGEYTYIGASSLVLPGVTIGKGCLIAAGSIVSHSIPDGSIASGNPAKVVGTTVALDAKYFSDEVIRRHYYDPAVIERFMRKGNGSLHV
jgi:acetyltransferase-like isoleucine patch superfamily enzyme